MDPPSYRLVMHKGKETKLEMVMHEGILRFDPSGSSDNPKLNDRIVLSPEEGSDEEMRWVNNQLHHQERTKLNCHGSRISSPAAE